MVEINLTNISKRPNIQLKARLF